MNIAVPHGINVKDLKGFLKLYKCGCGSTKPRPLAFVIGATNAAFLYECIGCYKHTGFVFTKMPMSTNDLIINMVNDIDDLNKQLEREKARCSKCTSGVVRSIDVTKCNRMALDIVECNNCHFIAPIVSVVRNTIVAYSHDIQLGKKVAEDYPEIALVFCVSAIETYFRQLFQYHSELNMYLVDKRKVNFQALSETKDIIKKEFGINIPELISKDWQFLCEKFQWRHLIIHNASHDRKGNIIEVSQPEINRLFSVADDLVYKVEMELFNRNIVI
jgi:hypothetical protein